MDNCHSLPSENIEGECQNPSPTTIRNQDQQSEAELFEALF